MEKASIEQLRSGQRRIGIPQKKKYYIYVIRDRNVILYVGYSNNVMRRLNQHIKQSDCIGWLIENNNSSKWMVWTYPFEECEKYVKRFFSEGHTQFLQIMRGDKPLKGKWYNIPEKAMIRRFRPCLNTWHNTTPSQLPDGRYKISKAIRAELSQRKSLIDRGKLL